VVCTMTVMIVRSWKALAFRGLVGVMLGVIPIMWPSISLFGLVTLFGIYALVDGLLLIASAPHYRSRGQAGAFATEGAIGVLAAIVAFAWPSMGISFFINLIAFWALLTGALEVSVALRLRHLEVGGLHLGASGFASILLGVLILGWPNVSALVIVTLLGCYALSVGVSMVSFAFQMRQIDGRSIRKRAPEVAAS
jgi:uncharacterized membrane protein HdeD (DUF308 family)